MTSARRCSQGHDVPGGEDTCPVCGESLPAAPAAPGRSLWELMKHPGAADEEGSGADKEQEDNPETSHPRGLWEMMGKPEAADEEGSIEDEEGSIEDEEGSIEDEERGGELESETGQPRGLWDVMRRSETRPETPAGEKEPVAEMSITLPDDEPVSLEELAEIEATEDTRDLREEATEPVAREVTRRSPRCLVSLGLGSLALPLSAVAALPPEPWTRLPALLVGLAAVHSGLVGLNESRASGGSRADQAMAITGATLGTVGMFLFSLASWLL